MKHSPIPTWLRVVSGFILACVRVVTRMPVAHGSTPPSSRLSTRLRSTASGKGMSAACPLTNCGRESTNTSVIEHPLMAFLSASIHIQLRSGVLRGEFAAAVADGHLHLLNFNSFVSAQPWLARLSFRLHHMPGTNQPPMEFHLGSHLLSASTVTVCNCTFAVYLHSSAGATPHRQAMDLCSTPAITWRNSSTTDPPTWC